MPDQTLRTVGVIYQIPLSELHLHPQNPFAIRDDPLMRELTESVQKSGVLVPAIVRPREAGGYEIIAGHRRKHACEQSGLDSMPVIILELNDNESIIQMVDSNIQRENILPSERAKAYKMRMEAMKHRAGRPSKESDKNSPKISANFRSDDEVGNKAGISGDTVRNYIALNNLTPPLMQMVDEKKIALSPAYQLAALSEKEQEHFGNHGQRAGYPFSLPGSANEKAQPKRRAERGHHAVDYDGAEKAGSQ